MSQRSDKAVDPGLIDVVWAIILIQGGVLILSAFEGFIGGFFFGSLPAALSVGGLSLSGAILALLSARGIRHRRRWARRLTIIAEWLVLAGGLLNALATSLMAAEVAGLVSVLMTIVVPLTVIIMLHNLRSFFVVDQSEDELGGQLVMDLEQVR